MSKAAIHIGDVLSVLRTLPDESVHACVTSPPYYGLRDYGLPPTDWPEISYSPMPGLPPVVIPPMKCCLGLEPTPEAYTAHLVHVYRLVWRVLRDDATAWLNLGDSYAADRGGTPHSAETLAGGTGGKTKEGHPTNRGRHDGYTPTRNAKGIGLKHKDLVGIPWRVAFALQSDGWYLRQDIIWHKPNPMPESVQDRCTKAHEYIFLLSKSERYFYDNEAIKEPSVTNDPRRPYGSQGAWDEESDYDVCSRNKRSVWSVPTKPFSEAHFAVFPPALIEPCILAGTSQIGCCPECGAPWQRVVEKGEPNKEPTRGRQSWSSVTGQRDSYSGGLPIRATTTTGWQPTCECGGSPVPCTVLDPFSGAGTTGLVALAKGRDYIGIELNPDYAEMSKRRIVKASPLLNVVDMIDHRIEHEAA